MGEFRALWLYFFALKKEGLRYQLDTPSTNFQTDLDSLTLLRGYILTARLYSIFFIMVKF